MSNQNQYPMDPWVSQHSSEGLAISLGTNEATWPSRTTHLPVREMIEPINTATTLPAAPNPSVNMPGFAQADMPPHGSSYPCGIRNGQPVRAQQEAQTSERNKHLLTVTKSPVILPCHHTYNMNVHATSGLAPLKGLEMGQQTSKSTCSDVLVGTPANGGWESLSGRQSDIMTTAPPGAAVEGVRIHNGC
jgi:hypothetical protein